MSFAKSSRCCAESDNVSRLRGSQRSAIAHLAMACADVVQMLCEGKLPGDCVLFWPGMLQDEVRVRVDLQRVSC